MRTVLHHVAPVEHQSAPVLETRRQAAEHPGEDAFDASEIEVERRKDMMLDRTHFVRRTRG